ILGKFGCTNFSDTYPPAPMTLNASPGALSGSARLTWNAPGDDEVIGGGAGASSSYEIRYSVSATFTSGQFASQTAIGDTPPTPQPAGNTETMIASGLSGNNFWFMVKAIDDQGLASYSNCAYVHLPTTGSSPSVLVFDKTTAGLSGFYGGSYPTLFDGNNDAGQLGDIWGTPYARALNNLGYAYDYTVNTTDNTGYPYSVNVLPTLDNYDIVFILATSRAFFNDPDELNTGFSGGDNAALNTYLHTADKNLYFEDWWIMNYAETYAGGDGWGDEAQWWDSVSADDAGWYITTDGAYISNDGIVSAFSGESNTFSICKDMKFKFDNAKDPDTCHNALEPRSFVDTDYVLTVSETACDSGPQLATPGFHTTIAHWQRNLNVKTIVSGSCMPGLSPYDEFYYYNSTFENYIKNIMAFFGYGGAVTVTSVYPILTPEWGDPATNPNDIFYVRSHYGSNIALMKATDAGILEAGAATAFTHTSANMHHASSIAIGGGYIYYGNYNTTETGLEIYRIPQDDSAAAAAYYPHKGDGNDHIRWYDPDYIDGSAFADGKPKIICGHDGDLSVYVANDDPVAIPELEVVRLTGFPTDPETGSAVNTWVYQPKWSPDGDSVVFVLRPPTANTSVAKTGIYIISGVKEIIAGNTSIVSSTTDSRVTEIQKYGEYVCWSPTFSSDGGSIVFSKDENDFFNNYDYAQLGISAKTFFEVNDGAAFDIYQREINPNVYFASKAGAGETLDAFVDWSKEGGDKISDTKYDAVKKTFQLSIFTGLENSSGATKNRAGETVYEIKDHSNASIFLNADPAEYALKSVKISPVMKKLVIPNGYKYFGASRIISTSPSTYKLPEGTDIKIGFKKASVRGIESKDREYKLFYIDNGKLVPVKSTILQNDYFYFVYAAAEKTGVYTVLSVPKASAYTDLAKARLFPSLIKKGKDDDGTITEGIAIDKLPDNVTNITIYNIAGEQVGTVDNAVEFAEAGTLLTTLPTGYTVDAIGASAYWNLKNDDGDDIASGVYIVVVKLNNGKSIYKKVAIIK
ncbi:hypothetical protein J7L48_02070, partial [bacterium]|nr:hypothetical protein [bacterium]